MSSDQNLAIFSASARRWAVFLLSSVLLLAIAKMINRFEVFGSYSLSVARVVLVAAAISLGFAVYRWFTLNRSARHLSEK